MKDNFRVILAENETYQSVADNILQKTGIKNYKRYIDNIYLEKFLSRLDYKVDEVEDDANFEIKIIKKICFYPCLNQIIDSVNYCSLHNKDMI